MTPGERTALVQKYKDGYSEVLRALEGIGNDEWDFSPGDGKWSAREIVHHLADSEMTSAIRIRRLLAEDNPMIFGYDQERFARVLNYRARPLEPALKAFEYARSSTVQILETMTDGDWKRAGVHSESGHYTAENWLEIYAAHAHGHADQIRGNRQAFKTR